MTVNLEKRPVRIAFLKGLPFFVQRDFDGGNKSVMINLHFVNAFWKNEKSMEVFIGDKASKVASRRQLEITKK